MQSEVQKFIFPFSTMKFHIRKIIEFYNLVFLKNLGKMSVNILFLYSFLGWNFCDINNKAPYNTNYTKPIQTIFVVFYNAKVHGLVSTGEKNT